MLLELWTESAALNWRQGAKGQKPAAVHSELFNSKGPGAPVVLISINAGVEMFLLHKAKQVYYYFYYHDDNNILLVFLYFVWSGMWRTLLLTRACITAGLCAAVISPSLTPGIPKSSIFHFSFYLDLGCDESGTCLLSPGFSGEHSHQNVMRWSRWSTISSFPALGVWTSNTSFMITSLDLLAMFLLLQLRVQLTFAIRLHSWLLLNLFFPRTPRSFSSKLLSSPSLSCCSGLSVPEAGLCLWTSWGSCHAISPACWDASE